MPRKIFRYSPQHMLQHWQQFGGQPLDFVMKSGRTWHGLLLKVENNTLHIKDMLGKLQKLPADTLEEVVATVATEI